VDIYHDEELRPLAQTAQRFATKEILGKVVNLESLEKSGFPWEAISAGGQAGFLCGPLDEELGGASLGLPAMAVLIEKLAEGAAGPAAIFAMHLAATAALASVDAVRPLFEEMAAHSTDAQPFLVGVALPRTAVSIDRPAVPEVVEEGGDLTVTGDFVCLPAPEVCHRVLVVTGEKDAHPLIVDAERIKPLVGEVYPGSGLDEFPPAGLKLDDFKASDDEVLEKSVPARLYRNLRVLLAAVHLGNACAATRTAWEYAEERIQTGRKIIEHQEVRRILENMTELTEAMIGTVRLAAGAPEGEAASDMARRAYTFSGTAGEQVCLDAIQTLGGYGYMKDYGIEKRTRDAKSIQCLLGTYPEDILGGI